MAPANEHLIDLDAERPLSLNQARDILPGNPSHPTVYRWATSGVQGIRLETVRVGRARYTSVGAVQRFLDRLAAQQAQELLS